MTEPPERTHLTITLVRDDDQAYRATEPGSSVTGRGDSAHAAVIDYAERARAASQEAQASD